MNLLIGIACGLGVLLVGFLLYDVYLDIFCWNDGGTW